ncbi:mitochondrial FAD-linked sulfhydryl oxidase [Geosmithia morbida]|uniref:Sulfhydryl oxidase n=1 Tax=Geosmithia morbida TaxID=1094350 RepID=A0A9P4YWI6_9HYPO|nr:mitochondrial FAD-linked sulfhydryl oxidase [Geosmithia morbida]KAF4123011.1 mitochondrial FAD-linked sulfhydryl oxidase [Geosmithia morbida]
MARSRHLALTILLALAVFLSLSYMFSSPPAPRDEQALGLDLGRTPPPPDTPPPSPPPPPSSSEQDKETSGGFVMDLDSIPPAMFEGDSIAPKLENATLKAELGRATWKFMHTMMARFPEKPSDDDRRTLDTFIHLFGRLYPCGDCARHFRALLAEYPPQTSSRNTAAGWLCFVHNLVNERLEKPVFDCNNLGDFYDCGCGEEGSPEKSEHAAGAAAKAEELDAELHRGKE